MKRLCSVRDCYNDISRNSHSFPSNETLRKKWLKAIRRKNWRPNQSRKICSAHFKITDFVEVNKLGLVSQRRYLKANVVPSIFPWNYEKLQNELGKNTHKQEALTSPEDSSKKKNIQSNAHESGCSINTDELPSILETVISESQEDDDLIELFIPSRNIINEIEVATTDSDCEHSESEIDSFSKSANENKNEEPIKMNLKFCFNFSIEAVQQDDEMVHFYSGLENYDNFLFVFQTLGPAAYELTYIYGKPPSNINAINAFFLTLIILRQNKTYFEVARFFNITEKQVGNIFITWVKFMYLQWSAISQWPSKELVKFYTPHDFKLKFPSTRAILDGTEIPIFKPGLPLAQQATFSTYKHKSTVKSVIVASPGGLISYVSPSYAGSTSDRQLIERTDFIKKCDPEDSLMADKGFDIQDILAPYGIKLNIPSFFKKRSKISEKNKIKDKKISSKRVHIERIIRLGKTYKSLNGPLTHTQTLLSEEIIFICFMLCNFRKTIVGPNA